MQWCYSFDCRATHNMYAYRIYDEQRGVWIQDNDDDGESAAGSRMLHLVIYDLGDDG